MSHDLYATWATTEIVRIIKNEPLSFFKSGTSTSGLTAFANRESGRKWPIPDGRISADIASKNIEVAIELKRINEGLHGTLTAIGQAAAYLHKGYNSSIIIIPNSYISHSNPGEFISNVISNTNSNLPIGVYSYLEPDTSLISPFYGKLLCHRPVNYDIATHTHITNPLKASSNTQWAHLREGSSEAHAFFKYLQTAKYISAVSIISEPDISYIPTHIIEAIGRIDSSISPLEYLSNSSGHSLHDIIWRNFWFNNIVTADFIELWISRTPYVINDMASKLIIENGRRKKFFSGKTNSIKNKLVEGLNNSSLSEPEALELYVKNIRSRAHSYREDIDSGLDHLGFLEDDGRPTELGYRFIDICERTSDYYSGPAKRILGSAILKNGDMAAFLHYFFKISENIFSKNPLEYSNITTSGEIKFDKSKYLNRIREELVNKLSVMNVAITRGGVSRQAFQAELAVLGKFDFIGNNDNRFRIGNGLVINWPLVQEYLNYEL